MSETNLENAEIEAKSETNAEIPKTDARIFIASSSLTRIIANRWGAGNTGTVSWTISEEADTRILTAWYTVEADMDYLPRFKEIVAHPSSTNPGKVIVRWRGDNAEAFLGIRLFAVYTTR